MTGTGTQADPLCPTNWQEFLIAIGTSGAYVSCPEDEIWDMNEIDPTGISAITPWNAVEVQGNGLTIRNLVFKSAIRFSADDILQEVYKLNFLNMYDADLTGAAFYYNANQHPIFKNCEMTGQFSTAIAFNGIDFSHDGEKSCSIAVNLLGSAQFVLNSCNFFGCKINLSGSTTAEMDSANALRANYCYFTGTNPYETLKINTYCKGNVIDMVVPEGTAVSYSTWYKDPYFIGIVNTDKLFGTYKDFYKPVTTAQLTDTAYLQSIGFPVV